MALCHNPYGYIPMSAKDMELIEFKYDPKILGLDYGFDSSVSFSDFFSRLINPTKPEAEAAKSREELYFELGFTNEALNDAYKEIDVYKSSERISSIQYGIHNRKIESLEKNVSDLKSELHNYDCRYHRLETEQSNEIKRLNKIINSLIK